MKSLLIVIVAISFGAKAETKFNLSGDAYVKGLFKNSSGNNGTKNFNQFFRLKVDAKADENLSVKSGLVLSGNSWEGDTHSTDAVGGTHEDGLGKGDTTRLDHAFIEYNKDGYIGSIGRMAVTSPGGFLTFDDRRDRIQVMKLTPTYDAFVVVFDKRYEGVKTNERDDLNMYSVNYYGNYNQIKYALQSGYWIQKNPTPGASLDNIKQFTPQLSLTAMNLNFDFYYTILWGGSTLYKNDHHSVALKLSKDLEMMKVEAQTIITKDGGLVASGFDSLSSIINNSPDHNQSGIKLRSIGSGLGNKSADEYVHMLRFSKKMTENLNLGLGIGTAKLFISTSTPLEKNNVIDSFLNFSLTKNLNLNVAYGRFAKDNEDHAGSFTVNAIF